MSKKIKLTSINILDKKKYLIFWIDELRDEIIIFKNKNNEIKIFSSICPHFGGEIFYDFKNYVLRCKWHDWIFCSQKGKCLSYPIKGTLKPYDFNVNPNNLKNYKFDLIGNDIYLLM